MPSTFSPNLRIELIGNGEQAGNWGSTTNTNLGTLVEDAISGYVTVSVTSANQAFTYADGASDQARNAVIELTTTTGAAFNVYAPPSPKTYVIYNASAHTATIYNSTVVGNTTAAGAGIAIQPGKSLTVWTNGTSFRLQNDNVLIPSGTRLLFQQSTAPVGWTKDTTQNNKALRIVSGTTSSGGSVAFTTAFSSQAVSGTVGNTTATNIATTATNQNTIAGGTVGNTTLTTAQMPSHNHGLLSAQNLNDASGDRWFLYGGFNVGGAAVTDQITATGGNQAHNHSFSGAAHSHTQDAHNHTQNAHNHSFTGTAINLDVQYVDAIIATKD
jgi:hypothetical protein